jgi:hypothetical protein
VEAMAKEDAFSVGTAHAPLNGGTRETPGNFSPPKPEEGVRLVHAFHGIKHAALREAIIKFITELSTMQKDGL